MPRRSVFEDGFGKRHHAVGPGGEPLEVLEFAEHFTAVPSFESALRERVNALVGFQNTCFARVRSVQRLGQNGSRLVVVSDRVPGARLSTVLAVAKQQLLPLEVNAALCLIRQLVPAMAALHDKMPAVGHGALAPERIIITPNARLVVVDHMLGAAVERLGYSHDRYWKELRLPLPTAAQPTFDFRADVMQIGMVALALILGRPLDSDDYPDQVAALAEGAWGLTATGGVEPLPPELRTWLSRMLQLDPRHSFVTAVDAWSDLEHVLGTSDYVASFGALKSFMGEYARYAATAAAPPAAAPSAPASAPAAPPAMPVAPPAAAVAAPARSVAASVVSSQPASASPAPAPVARAAAAPIVPGQTPARVQQPAPPAVKPHVPVPPAPVAVAPTPAPVSVPRSPVASSTPAKVPGPAAPSPRPASPPPPPPPAATMTERLRAVAGAYSVDDSETGEKHGTPWWRQPRVAAAAVVLVALVGGGALLSRSSLPSASAEAPGTLTVTTNPAGVPVVIDGEPRGVTPLTLELAPGRHELRLAANGGNARVIPLTITAGGTVSQSIELPTAGPQTGQLTVRTEPSGARVTIDGMAQGQTPLTLEGLTPGNHTVVLANDVSSVTHEVMVQPGATASLVVPMSSTPQDAPVSGWISVSAPAEVQVYRRHTAPRDEPQRSHHGVGGASRARHRERGTRLPSYTRRHRCAGTGCRRFGSNGRKDRWRSTRSRGPTSGSTATASARRPIGNVSVPIGSHEIVFRHPQLGEQVVRATVTAGQAAKVSVDMRKR